MKPRVCMYTDSLAPSGVGEHMLCLAEQLRDEYTVSFACPPSPSGCRLLERAGGLGLDTVEVDGAGADQSRLTAMVDSLDLDLLHVHAGVCWEGHDGIRAARAAGVPAIVRTEHLAELTAVFELEELPDLVHSPYHLPDRRPGVDELARRVAEDRGRYLGVADLVDLVICVSAGVRDSYVAVGLDPAKARVVRNGIEPTPAATSVEETRARLGIAPEKRVVLSVGRLIDVKGHQFTLGAIEKVMRRVPDSLFVWVGNGPLEDDLAREVHARGLDDHVLFTGHRDDVPDLIAASDLFVLTSMVEGLPLVVLEAMAAGRPVVGTRVCGTSEAVRDGVTGRLVEPGTLDGGGDTDALAAAILEPLEDRELARRWGDAGRETFEREFTSAHMARETAKVYAELVD
jgi:glycosyltransferase involved in cell wall biosynthesis